MRSQQELLAEIASAVGDADRLVHRGYAAFVDDPLLIRAATNIVLEIGEAVKALDAELLDSMPGVPWKSVKGMRDKVVHDYPGVDLDVLWETLAQGLPSIGVATANRPGTSA